MAFACHDDLDLKSTKLMPGDEHALSTAAIVMSGDCWTCQEHELELSQNCIPDAADVERMPDCSLVTI